MKGLALLHPELVRMGPAGLPQDRLFYLVDATGRLFGGSRHGPIVRIVPEFDPADERLELRFPDDAVVAGDASALGEPIETDFYGRPVPGHLVEGPWSDAVSRFAGTPVRLARCDRPGDGADVHHVTIVSRESVEEVARQGEHDDELDPRRFRMNIEIRGCRPHEEDGWDGRLVRVGEAVIRLRGQVPRCVVTTQSPSTGRKDFETLKVIARYRPPIEGRRGIPFGMYAEVEGPGDVHVGDQVEPTL